MGFLTAGGTIGGSITGGVAGLAFGIGAEQGSDSVRGEDMSTEGCTWDGDETIGMTLGEEIDVTDSKEGSGGGEGRDGGERTFGKELEGAGC